MCYPQGSIDESMALCPMCKVFKPSGARCPHVRDVCRNKNSHPRHDVVYLKNAEVKSFNGCGYCKWAKTNPPINLSGHQNPGWPGCCRAPGAGEQRYVQAADWLAVSIVHSVPIPPEIKNILDTLSRNSPNGSTGGGGGRGVPLPLMDRRNSSTTNLSKPIMPTKSSPVLIPGKGRSGGSPRLGPSILAKPDVRGGVPSSLPTCSINDQFQSPRRSAEHADKSRSPSSRNSPSRKHVELEGSLSRRGSSARRPSVSLATPSISKITMDAQIDPQSPQPQPTLERRASVSSTHSLRIRKPSPPGSRTADRQISTSSIRAQSKMSGLEGSMAAMNISSASSSSGSESGESSLGSMTDSTVTSDGGFTDYLSDESEAELQRQAEVKAAIVAQNQAEEQEFKAARQQLTFIDLRPPNSWNSLTSNSRPQGGSMNAYSASTFGTIPFAAGAIAQTGEQTRG